MNKLDINKISDILIETFESNNVDVSSLQFNNDLNDLLWENNKLKSEVRKTLLLNAKKFIEFCDLEKFKFNDIILTGSMANYNYTSNSDIDIHIIFNFKQLSVDEDFLEQYFKLKKTLWSETIPVKVKGFDVEMYVQNSDEKHSSTGMYSLINNDWVVKPTKKIINIDTNNIKLKANAFIDEIDELLKIQNLDLFQKKYELLKNKLRNYRKTGLSGEGEYSTENLVFKILRNTGYLGKLMKSKNMKLSKELSLK